MTKSVKEMLKETRKKAEKSILGVTIALSALTPGKSAANRIAPEQPLPNKTEISVKQDNGEEAVLQKLADIITKGADELKSANSPVTRSVLKDLVVTAYSCGKNGNISKEDLKAQITAVKADAKTTEILMSTLTQAYETGSQSSENTGGAYAAAFADFANSAAKELNSTAENDKKSFEDNSAAVRNSFEKTKDNNSQEMKSFVNNVEKNIENQAPKSAEALRAELPVRQAFSSVLDNLNSGYNSLKTDGAVNDGAFDSGATKILEAGIKNIPFGNLSMNLYEMQSSVGTKKQKKAVESIAEKLYRDASAMRQNKGYIKALLWIKQLRTSSGYIQSDKTAEAARKTVKNIQARVNPNNNDVQAAAYNNARSNVR